MPRYFVTATAAVELRSEFSVSAKNLGAAKKRAATVVKENPSTARLRWQLVEANVTLNYKKGTR